MEDDQMNVFYLLHVITINDKRLLRYILQFTSAIAADAECLAPPW
jgi:hypothetical protein